jgi:hypothetical protein
MKGIIFIMRMPSRQDDELLQTLQISVHTSSHVKLTRHLENIIVKQPDDPEPHFALGLFSWVMMSLTTDNQDKHRHLVGVIEHSSNAIAIDAKHWPALFLRSMVRLMMNDTAADEMATYLLPTDYSVRKAVNDQKTMMDIQESTRSPFCAVPFVLVAYALLLDDDSQSALATLIEASDNIEMRQMPCWGRILRLPFLALYKKAYSTKLYDIALVMKDWIACFFPDQNFTIGRIK